MPIPQFIHCIIMVTLLNLTGCGLHDRYPQDRNAYFDDDTEFVPAQRTAEPVVAEPTPTLPPPKTMALPTKQPFEDSPQEPTDALETIDEANRLSTVRSTEDGFVSATQFFDYFPGTLYEIVASPGYITTVVLDKGEQLLTKASGDTTRWIVEQTVAGQGPGNSDAGHDQADTPVA